MKNINILQNENTCTALEITGGGLGGGGGVHWSFFYLAIYIYSARKTFMKAKCKNNRETLLHKSAIANKSKSVKQRELKVYKTTIRAVKAVYNYKIIEYNLSDIKDH